MATIGFSVPTTRMEFITVRVFPDTVYQQRLFERQALFTGESHCKNVLAAQYSLLPVQCCTLVCDELVFAVEFSA